MQRSTVALWIRYGPALWSNRYLSTPRSQSCRTRTGLLLISPAELARSDNRLLRSEVSHAVGDGSLDCNARSRRGRRGGRRGVPLGGTSLAPDHSEGYSALAEVEAACPCAVRHGTGWEVQSACCSCGDSQGGGEVGEPQPPLWCCRETARGSDGHGGDCEGEVLLSQPTQPCVPTANALAWTGACAAIADFCIDIGKVLREGHGLLYPVDGLQEIRPIHPLIVRTRVTSITQTLASLFLVDSSPTRRMYTL